MNEADQEPVNEFPSRERSPFAGLTLGSGPEAAFGPALAASLTERFVDEATCCGQLLASAIWNGALLGRQWWQVWLGALPHGVRMDGCVWVEMAAADPGARGDPSGHPRRWFADPVSQLLLLRWCGDQRPTASHVGLTAEACLEAFLKTAYTVTPEADLVSEFLRAAEVHWRMRMPGVLVDYATGRSRSFACSSATWRRLITGRAVPVGEIEKAKVDKRRLNWADSSAWSADKTHHDAILHLLNLACQDEHILSKTQQKNQAVQALKSLEEDGLVTPAGQLLRRWCIAMLTKGLQANGKNYRPSSARNYLKVLRREVFYPGSGLEVLEVAPGLLRQRCIEAVERLPPCDYRNTLISAVQAFARHLQANRPALWFDAACLQVFYSQSVPRVNLISSADYRSALASLKDRTAVDVRLLRMCLILGYRTGLRLHEIRALTVDDFSVVGQPGDEIVELVVRRKRHTNTKTEWSRRVLPLHLLLARHADPRHCELDELLAWLRDCSRLYQWTGNPCLFVTPEEPLVRVKQRDFLETPLTAVLQQVTGDENITVGALRHSFVSNLLATLLIPADSTCLPVPRGLDDDALSIIRKERLEAALIGREKLGQAALHAVSQLVGHAPVSTSLSSYTHLLDWCVGAHVCRPAVQPQFEMAKAVALTGMTAAAIRKGIQRANGRAGQKADSSSGYIRPELTRVRRGKGRPSGAPAKLTIHRVLPAATRLRLQANGLELVEGEPTVRRIPLVRQSQRESAPEWLNWRLVKAVIDEDKGRGSELALAEIARSMDVSMDLAWRWVSNRRLFMSGSAQRRWVIGRGERPAQHLTSRALPGSRLAHASSELEPRDFPRAPERYEVPFVDKLWAVAGRKAKPIWQRALQVFRTGYNTHQNEILATNWRDARAFRELLFELEVLSHFEVRHRPQRGRARTDNIASLLIRNHPPRGWRGEVLFKLKARGTAGRGYGLRFLLTMLAITDAEVLSAARRERLGFIPVAANDSECLKARSVM